GRVLALDAGRPERDRDRGRRVRRGVHDRDPALARPAREARRRAARPDRDGRGRRAPARRGRAGRGARAAPAAGARALPGAGGVARAEGRARPPGLRARGAARRAPRRAMSAEAPGGPDLSVVVVNFQCAGYTLGLLDTLFQDRFEVEGRPGRLEVTIVDNAS